MKSVTIFVNDASGVPNVVNVHVYVADAQNHHAAAVELIGNTLADRDAIMRRVIELANAALTQADA